VVNPDKPQTPSDGLSQILPIRWVDKLYLPMCVREYPTAHTDWINKAVFTKDNTKFITCSDDNNIHIYEVSSGHLSLTLSEHEGNVRNIILLSDGRLASCGWRPDNTVKIWNIENGLCEATFKEHTQHVHTLLELPGSMLLSGSSDKKICIWNLLAKDSHLYASFSNSSLGSVNCIVRIDDKRIAVSSDNDVQVYEHDNVSNFKLLKTLTGHLDQILDMKYVKNTEWLISSGGNNDKTCKLWDLLSGKCIRTFVGHTQVVRSVAVVSKSVFVSSANEIKFWNLDSGECVKTVCEGKDRICHVSTNASGQLVSCGADQKVRVWQI